MTNGEIFRLLKSSGFTFSHQGGSHMHWYKDGLMILTSRGGKPMGPRMINDILVRIRKSMKTEERRKEAARKATVGEVKVGRKVKARRPFVDVPAGTVGVVEQDYGPGFFILWANGIRDAFDKARELVWLEAVA